jgi:hypothetical protein
MGRSCWKLMLSQNPSRCVGLWRAQEEANAPPSGICVGARAPSRFPSRDKARGVERRAAPGAFAPAGLWVRHTLARRAASRRRMRASQRLQSRIPPRSHLSMASPERPTTGPACLYRRVSGAAVLMDFNFCHSARRRVGYCRCGRFPTYCPTPIVGEFVVDQKQRVDQIPTAPHTRRRFKPRGLDLTEIA